MPKLPYWLNLMRDWHMSEQAHLLDAAERVGRILTGLESGDYETEERDLFTEVYELHSVIREACGLSRELQATLERGWKREDHK